MIEDKYILKPCPLCGGNLKWIFPVDVLCLNCHVTFSVDIASGRSLAHEIINRRFIPPEVVEMQSKLDSLRRYRYENDCRYTMGAIADIDGIHCPIDRPCTRCKIKKLIQCADNLIASHDPSTPESSATKIHEERFKDALSDIKDEL